MLPKFAKNLKAYRWHVSPRSKYEDCRVDEGPGLKPLSLFLAIFRGLKAPASSDEILTYSEGIFAPQIYRFTEFGEGVPPKKFSRTKTQRRNGPHPKRSGPFRFST